jgi:preprotein translocase subunit SecF
MRLFRDAKYHFLDARRRAYVASVTLIVVGLVSIVVQGGLNAGVEFTGGTLLQVRFTEQAEAGDLRDLLTGLGFGGAQIQQLRAAGIGGGEGESEFLFRVQTFEQTGDSAVGDRVGGALEGRYGADGYEIVRVEAVGPRVGGELQVKATWAILLSFLLTLIYLAFRFEWRFGVAAVIATIHDIVITFGFISLLNIEITLATVAALLTIVGYSLNDTIVVFDRVRENMRKKRKEAYGETLNRSINETLPRTVLTSGTTLVALVSLFVLGGAVIRPFALVLILGVLIGTYSSIFVASPALLEIHDAERRRSKRAAHQAAS